MAKGSGGTRATNSRSAHAHTQNTRNNSGGAGGSNVQNTKEIASISADKSISASSVNIQKKYSEMTYPEKRVQGIKNYQVMHKEYVNAQNALDSARRKAISLENKAKTDHNRQSAEKAWMKASEKMEQAQKRMDKVLDRFVKAGGNERDLRKALAGKISWQEAMERAKKYGRMK